MHFQHALFLPGLLPHAVLQPLLGAVERGVFTPDEQTGANFRFEVLQDLSPNLLAPLSAPAFVARIEAASGLTGLGAFRGQVKRVGSGHRFPWHQDKNRGQRLGISIDLSRQRYEGGAFEVRWKWDREVLMSIRPQAPGDAHLIDVAEARTVHRISPVVGPIPRTFLAGWYW
jgi:hypothetical protein